MNETPLRNGRYAPSTSSGDSELGVQLDDKAEPVPVAIWDPDMPEKHSTPYSHQARPLRVTLNEGDMLYLPAMWYHKVSQTAGEEGFVCAVNYWYDMDFTGHFWSGNSFVRDVVGEEKKRPAYPPLDMSGDEAGP